jgi:hypothetical protein
MTPSTTLDQKITNQINNVSTLLALAPAIIQLMMVVESIFRKPRSGGLKKDVVMAAVPEELKTQAGTFVDHVVSKLNDRG